MRKTKGMKRMAKGGTKMMRMSKGGTKMRRMAKGGTKMMRMSKGGTKMMKARGGRMATKGYSKGGAKNREMLSLLKRAAGGMGYKLTKK
tara:strand:+ start:759 stop:1025 length:267 start_codon:yes stop_codon:yes gene_type:complete